MLTKKKKRVITSFRPTLRTKNHTAEDLRDSLYQHRFNKPVIIRLGSLTQTSDITSRTEFIEINKVEAINISRSKLLMHKAFDTVQVTTAKYFTDETFPKNQGEIKFPLLAKKVTGQGGSGMLKLDDLKQYTDFYQKNGNSINKNGYYIEEYFNGAREYRVHVTADGAFLAWRKMRKSDAKDRWFFNSENCVWVGEDNALFDKPVNWEAITQECVKALNAVGLDIGAIDVRVQSSKDEDNRTRKECKFVILETNSAPSLGKIGSEYYYKEILRLINKKIG